MSKFWFRKNHAPATPARMAETQNLLSRHEAFDRAKEATIHLLTALKQWPGFDSTDNINGAIDHTLVNIDRLDDALDDLRDQVDKFRAMQVAEMVRRSGHPSTLSNAPDPKACDSTLAQLPKLVKAPEAVEIAGLRESIGRAIDTDWRIGPEDGQQ